MTTTPDKATLPLTPGRWMVDTNHSSIGFTIRHLGVSKVRGRFTRFDADVVVGETLDTTSVMAQSTSHRSTPPTLTGTPTCCRPTSSTSFGARP
jgi:hypothetical protein